ncbi:Spo0E family sporulation regulatory protein-aspartic acid phosphatase [Gracilibacillus salinarum]|uniref:Spo0E family sporulation regulatory protein-aspartic acid phosphatase n=2 Tax=Gracilibacillus salinarum TaxID=2932255 RepID=A0ABY4GU14_9BACI|nr:Spo0E family sporulation regulatory protein-aspartic acid phosphatase [Gracilibacillus salinarum]
MYISYQNNLEYKELVKISQKLDGLLNQLDEITKQ